MMDETKIAEILAAAKTITVIGLSDKPLRLSFTVSSYMQQQGYRIVQVNPNVQETLGEKSDCSLRNIPEKIDIVNIFRRSDCAGSAVDDAIRVGVRCIWIQEGVVDYEAASRTEAAGIPVISNRCILKYHHRLVR